MTEKQLSETLVRHGMGHLVTDLMGLAERIALENKQFDQQFNAICSTYIHTVNQIKTRMAPSEALADAYKPRRCEASVSVAGTGEDNYECRCPIPASAKPNVIFCKHHARYQED